MHQTFSRATAWFNAHLHTVCYVGALIAILMIICYLCKTSNQVRCVKEIGLSGGKTAGTVINNDVFHAFGDGYINVYAFESGEQLGHTELPMRGMSGGKLINGDLVIALNAPRNSVTNGKALVWLDPQDHSFIDHLELPFIQHYLVLIGWHDEQWWLCDTSRADTKIYCFDSEWALLGVWLLPKELDGLIVADGNWFGNVLCVTGRQTPELYVLSLDPDKVHCTLESVLDLCFNGGNFNLQTSKQHIYAWGLQNRNKLVNCIVNI